MPTYTLEIGGKTYDIESEQPLTDDQLRTYAQQIAGQPAQPQLAAEAPQAVAPPVEQPTPMAEPEMPQPSAPAAEMQPVAQPKPQRELTYEETFGIRPTTPAGVASALTRGLAPVLGGAALGAMTPIPGGAAIGAGAAAVAPLVLDPAVEAVNRQFGTSFQTPSQALQALMTRMGVAQPQSAVERGIETTARGVGAGIAGPAGAARAAQLAAPAGSAVARTAEAVRVGGMGPAGAAGLTGLSGAGVRTGAAATSGAVGGLAAEGTPEAAVGGGALGALMPGAVGALKSVALGAWNSTFGRVLRPQQTAEDVLLNTLGGTPEAGREALAGVARGRQAPSTPGMPRNLLEILDAGGVQPTVDLAALSNRLANAGGDVSDQVLKFQRDQVGALRQSLLQVNDQLRVPMLTPGRRSELEGVRDSLLARVDAEEAILNAAARARGEALPGPQATGQEIAARAEQLSRELRRTLVTPAYDAAFQSAGSAKTNIDGLVAEAERVLGRPLSDFAPETAPPIVRQIMSLRQAQAPQPVGRGAISGRMMTRPGAPSPTMATLGELDDLRKAINATVAEARRGTSTLSGVEVSNLQGLHRSVDNAVKQSTVFSDETKQLYDTALANYRNIYAPRFREGETARILKPAMFGEMRVDPSQVVGSYLKDEDAADQFIRTFAGDATAFTSMRNGLVDAARRSAMSNFQFTPEKLQGWLQSNAPVLRRFEDAGMNLRGALAQVEQEAAQARAAFDNLATFRGPFEGKTADQMLTYITGDPARMSLALQRSNDTGRDAIRRVTAENLNQLIETNPAQALKELTDETKRRAYSVAFPNNIVPGRNLVNEFTERARLGVALQEVLQDSTLAAPGAAEVVIRRSNLSLPALQNLLKLAQDDIARIRRIDESATRGGATPRLGGLTREAAEQEGGAAVMPSSSLSIALNTIVRTFTNLEQKVNRKVNAELARVIYQDPEAAIQAITNAIQRAEKAKRTITPLRRIEAAVPAAAGTLGGVAAEEFTRQRQD
jgi:hypothetical protein